MTVRQHSCRARLYFVMTERQRSCRALCMVWGEWVCVAMGEAGAWDNQVADRFRQSLHVHAHQCAVGQVYVSMWLVSKALCMQSCKRCTCLVCMCVFLVCSLQCNSGECVSAWRCMHACRLEGYIRCGACSAMLLVMGHSGCHHMPECMVPDWSVCVCARTGSLVCSLQCSSGECVTDRHLHGAACMHAGWEATCVVVHAVRRLL